MRFIGPVRWLVALGALSYFALTGLLDATRPGIVDRHFLLHALAVTTLAVAWVVSDRLAVDGFWPRRWIVALTVLFAPFGLLAALLTTHGTLGGLARFVAIAMMIVLAYFAGIAANHLVTLPL
jgi:hypothetical protein